MEAVGKAAFPSDRLQLPLAVLQKFLRSLHPEEGDVLLRVNGANVIDTATLIRNDPSLLHGQALPVTVFRQQREIKVNLIP